MEQDFLNIDAYFEETNNDQDLWSHESHSSHSQREADADDDALLATTRLTGDEADDESDAMQSSVKTLSEGGDGGLQAVKEETTPEHGYDTARGCGGCYGHDDDDTEALQFKIEAQHSGSSAATGAATDSEPDSMDMLDDGTWLDFDPQSTGAELASPSFMRRFGMDTPSSDADGDDDANDFLCDGDDSGLLFGDVLDLPDFTDDDVAALVPSPVKSGSDSSRVEPSTLTVSTSSSRPVLPHSTPTPAGRSAAGAPLPSPSQFPNHLHNSVFVSDHDIPDIVNLFSSMHSPSEAVRLQQQQQRQQLPHHRRHSLLQFTPLSIMVPTSQSGSTTMFPFGNTAVNSPMPHHPPRNHHQPPPAIVPANQFEFYTPPGVTASATRTLDPNAMFMNADSLSPPTKNTNAFQQAQHLANGMRGMTQTQAQQQMQAATAAAVAMANSAAAMNTMRKLTQTYGVPIAPLKRSLVSDAQPLKPKLVTATATSSSTIAATFGASSKVSKISITPDISDFKLVQIFHNFCDPVTKVIPLPRFHQLLQFHQGKDEHGNQPAAAAAAAAAKHAAGITTPAKDTTVPTVESINLFKMLDKRNAGCLDLEVFMNSFQICNRCTEAKRKAHSAVCAAQGQSFVSTALERQLMEDVAPVLVRVVPTAFEGSKVKSCEHYQWTWCEGFGKTGNEKCRGTNRHDKCPKYLANCTLWKHKLPPKNRKSKFFENVESPSKKYKHFA